MIPAEAKSCDPTAPTGNGSTSKLHGQDGPNPLREAAGNGNAAGVIVLLDSTLERGPKSEGDTPLHRAVAHGHSGVATVLLDAGAQVMLRNRRGKTAWDIAHRYRVSSGHFNPLRGSPAQRRDASVR